MDRELNILIIEDEPRDAESIERELRDAEIPFRARRLQTRHELERELKASLPDIILSDFTLPGFDALEALRLLQARHADIPFILVTGSRSEEVAVECIKEGADDYILKASLKRLPSSIRNALAKKAGERARSRAEAALQRSEEQFRLIAESSRDLISVVDLDGRFIYASPSFKAGLGVAPEELAGASAFAEIHPEDREMAWNAWKEALASREGRAVEFRARHHDGEWRTFEAVSNWVFDEEGQPQRSVIVSRDISRRKHAEENLREMPRLIREAQETERRRVARELHDSVNQILSSVKFRVQALEDKLSDRADAAGEEAGKVLALLDRAIQEVRRISRNLRPSELDDLGLTPALRSLCAEFSERTGVEVALTFSRQPRKLNEDVELNLYRIVQEALNNIEKHARASRVDIRLAKEASVLRASIRDDGGGFDAAHVRQRTGRNRGMGLADMRERAAFVGGSCTVRSSREHGTEITIAIPLSQPTPPREEPSEKRNP